MNLCTALVEALYQVFTTPMVFPAKDEERFFLSLVALGYASYSAQGKSIGFRITPLACQFAGTIRSQPG